MSQKQDLKLAKDEVINPTTPEEHIAVRQLLKYLGYKWVYGDDYCTVRLSLLNRTDVCYNPQFEEDRGTWSEYSFFKEAGYIITPAQEWLSRHSTRCSNCIGRFHGGLCIDFDCHSKATEIIKTEIIIPEGHKAVINGQTITFEPISPQPKEGEFWKVINKSGRVYIFQKDMELTPKTSCTFAIEYGGCCSLISGKVNSDRAIHYLVQATEQEKQSLIEVVRGKYGKEWDETTRKWEHVLKRGDKAIFWDSDKRRARIAVLEVLDSTEPRIRYKDNNGVWRKNAIKCISLKQYDDFLKSE